MKKVGIITWHQYHNFGSALQASALRMALTSLGYDAQVINYQSTAEMSTYSRLIRCLIGNVSSLINVPILYRTRYSFLRFQEKYMKLTECVLDKDLAGIAGRFDAIICGSDQIWAPNVLNSVYLLNWFDGKTVRKISYAASIGLPIIPEKLLSTYRDALEDFYRISVREQAGQKLLKDIFDIHAKVVLDPTFLLTAEQYRKMEKSLPITKKEYVFCYFLNANHKYRNRVENFATDKSLSIIGVSVNSDDNDWMTVLGNEVGPAEFLYLVRNANYVFTDSYHGTIFSLLFHKEFYTFERFTTTDPINQNSRIYQLDNWFGIKDRIVSVEEKLPLANKFDYELFESKLAEYRDFSIKYLLDALS